MKAIVAWWHPAGGLDPLAGKAAIPLCFRLNGLNPRDCEWKNLRTAPRAAATPSPSIRSHGSTAM
jgi:hypothetical protein